MASPKGRPSTPSSKEFGKENGTPHSFEYDVKHLCGMGFSRTEAVAALEANSYDFQKALNSLLSAY
jgi:UBA/TS-N domain